MALAKHFITNELHPGAYRTTERKEYYPDDYWDTELAGQWTGSYTQYGLGDVDGGMIFFDDPDPDGTRFFYAHRLNFPVEKIMPLIWNMKQWNVLVNFAVEIKTVSEYYSPGPPPVTYSNTSTYEASIGASGKFSQLYHSFSDYYSSTYNGAYFDLWSTNAEPGEKASGKCNKIHASFDQVYLADVSILLPKVEMSTSTTSSNTSSSTVRDGNGAPSGNVTVICSGSASVSIEVVALYLKPDHTVDVFVYPTFSGGSFYMTKSNSGLHGKIGDTTINFLGNSFPVSIYTTDPIESYETITLTSFNLSYNIIVTEPWVYEEPQVA